MVVPTELGKGLFDPIEFLVTLIFLAGLAALLLWLFSIRRETFDSCLVSPEDQIVRLLLELGRADADDLGNRMFPSRAGDDIVPLIESMARRGILKPIHDLGSDLKPSQIPYRIA